MIKIIVYLTKLVAIAFVAMLLPLVNIPSILAEAKKEVETLPLNLEQ